MPHNVLCLDMELPELGNWVKANIRRGFDLHFGSTAAPDFMQRLAEADFLVLFESKINAETITNAPRLKLIQLPQVGYDNIDAGAATQAGVPVANTPGVTSISVAEHTLMLILATLRLLMESDASVRKSEWPQLRLFQKGLHDFNGSTLGIVGYGAIGSALARICRPLAGEILYFRRNRLSPEDEQAQGVQYARLDDLLRRADVVSLHVPLNESTRGLIGRAELELMKPEAILVNVARGGVVDYDAFLAHMRARRLRGAAFDVLWQEPPPIGDPLLAFDNIVFSPHIASGSQEGAYRALQAAFDNVYRVAGGGTPLHRVA